MNIETKKHEITSKICISQDRPERNPINGIARTVVQGLDRINV
jgi:hypothetical protein